jgi:hypothetical protein
MQMKVERMPSDGCWVTSERHEIKAIGASAPPIDVEKVISHFKQRIYTGLGVSPVDMGETGSSSRSTAQTLSRNLIDDTKADQKDFGAQFFLNVIVELLLESTYDQSTLFDDKELVYLKFKEIDFESRQAKENHLVDIYLKNAITHQEMRTAMGYSPFEGEGWPTTPNKSQMFVKGDGDWANTNYGLIERDKVLLQSLDEPGTPDSKEETKSRTKANNTKSAGGNSVANKNQPENQYQVRSATKTNHDIENLIKAHKTNGPITDKTIDKEFDSFINKLKIAYRYGLKDKKADPTDPKFIIGFNKIKNHINTVRTIKQKQFEELVNISDLDKSSIWFKDYLYKTEIQEIKTAFTYGQAAALLDKNPDKPLVFLEENEPVLKINNTDAIIYKELDNLYLQDLN